MYKMYNVVTLHISEFELGKLGDSICRRVAPDYAADLSVPILDRGRNAYSTMYSVHE